jgi:hypothetical protein
MMTLVVPKIFACLRPSFSFILFLFFLIPDSEIKKSPHFALLADIIEEKKSTGVAGDNLFLTIDYVDFRITTLGIRIAHQSNRQMRGSEKLVTNGECPWINQKLYRQYNCSTP